ncbi:MAG TPA: YgaP-like transmembrane domain [Solirubrobacteraceae bacterium]|nr:YgaP-like transmembrane domain [Solirubrobacteraceae bacterium]
MSLVRFMVSPVGRSVRIVAGVVLVVVGLVVQGAAGIAISVIGVVPIVAGALNVCLLGPLLGADIWGRPRAASGADR